MKITRDDAVGFIVAFSQHFNVDISNFNFCDYFKQEGLNMISSFLNWLLKTKRDGKSLTIVDLEEAVERRTLM